MTEQDQNHDRAEQRAATERLARARQQLAAATTEFQKALTAVRNPARRQELTTTYVGLLQRALANAQRGLDRYARQHGKPPTDDSPPDSAAPAGEGTTAAQ